MFKQVKLYSFVLPAMLMPLMFSFGNIPAWFKGTQFRGFVSDFLAAITQSVVDVFILFGVNSIFG